MRTLRTLWLLAIVLGLLGCELVADFDRTKIPRTHADAGPDGSTPDVPDADVPDTGPAVDASSEDASHGDIDDDAGDDDAGG